MASPDPSTSLEPAAATAGGGSLLDADGLGGGVLPRWAPWGVFAVAVALCAAALAALGIFTIALTLVFSVFVAGGGIYVWSRLVEGSRRATDRAVTIAIVAAFGLAMIPLMFGEKPQ